MGDAPEDSDPGRSAHGSEASAPSRPTGDSGGPAKGQRNRAGGQAGKQLGTRAGNGKPGNGKGTNSKGTNSKGTNSKGTSKGTNRGRGGSSGNPRAGGGRSGARSAGSRPTGRGRPGDGGPKGSPTPEAGAALAADRPGSAGGAPTTPPTDRSGERNEEESARVNRRRAVAIGLAPGVIAGAVVGAVLATWAWRWSAWPCSCSAPWGVRVAVAAGARSGPPVGGSCPGRRVGAPATPQSGGRAVCHHGASPPGRLGGHQPGSQRHGRRPGPAHLVPGGDLRARAVALPRRAGRGAGPRVGAHQAPRHPGGRRRGGCRRPPGALPGT